MEIWNNIWTALSTPNEGLVNILSIPFSLIEAYLSVLLFSTILNIDINKKQKILYILFTFLVGQITLNFIPSPFNTIVNYILFFIIIYFTFKIGILKSLVSVIIPTMITVLIGTLTLNPFAKIIHLDFDIARLIPIYRISYVTINYIIMLLIILFLKNKNIYLNILEEFDKKTKFILIVSFLLGLFVLILQILITAYYTNELPIIISFLSFISLISFIVMSIYTITRVVKLNLTTKQLANAEEYNKTLQILHDNVRCFKHDYDNTVATIGGYIRTNDMEGLKKYYKELEEDVIKVSSLYILNPNIINDPGIYSLLATKYHIAEELNIKMNLTVLLDLSTINMKIYEFTKILGILLDNSIDACKECEEKVINITFMNDEKNKRQLLIIENTYLDKNIDLDRIFEKGITSKENHTGLGLWEIRKILKRNNNLNLHTSKIDKYFKQQFEIYTN